MSTHSLASRIAKLWRKRTVTITEEDPTFKTVYLGNTITQWAKGAGSVDKPLATLWKNYCQSTKPDIEMRVTIAVSGLKATTRQHGLTEYWSHRITYAFAHPSYPKIFCWVYRHEGRKMKPELRCHAVLCSSEAKAQLMQKLLTERLHQALVEFRKEKQLRQNARLSVVSVLYPSTPRRKVFLAEGGANYRPPLERSKSAPKLSTVEEDRLGEEAADREQPTRRQWRRLAAIEERRRRREEAETSSIPDTPPISQHPLAGLPDHSEPHSCQLMADLGGRHPLTALSSVAHPEHLPCPVVSDPRELGGQSGSGSETNSLDSDGLSGGENSLGDSSEQNSLTSEQSLASEPSSAASLPSDLAAAESPHEEVESDCEAETLLLATAGDCRMYHVLDQLSDFGGVWNKSLDEDAASDESGYADSDGPVNAE